MNTEKEFKNCDARISIVDYKGEKWVRVEALGEDFVIAPRDLDNSKAFDYDNAMSRLKELGLDTFNRKQGFIIATYADEIDAKLREIGGDPMDRYCYVSKELWKPAGSVGEYNSSYSWHFNGYTRNLGVNNRCYSFFRVRPCLGDNVTEGNDKEEIRNYLKNSLKLSLEWNDCNYYICLKLDGETISKLKFQGI